MSTETPTPDEVVKDCIQPPDERGNPVPNRAHAWTWDHKDGWFKHTRCTTCGKREAA